MEIGEQYKKAYPNLVKRSEELANKGWLIAPSMDFGILTDLLKIEDIDGYYIKYYEIEDNYNLLKCGIMNCDLYSNFKPLLDEIFQCYENGLYKVIIPSALSVIEGGIAELTESNKYGRRLLRDIKNIEEIKKEGTVVYIFYNAIYVYLDNIFENYNFDNERKNLLNRNWVLHGKDNPNIWKKVDAVILLNTLYSLSLLSKKEF